MQEFLTHNTVNCNLMSLTGYRTLVILEALMESPKTIDEINNCLLNNQYIKERFSSDTLRIYINSLRSIGCEITAANKSNQKKYQLISHPFSFDITKAQLSALSKLSKVFYEKITIEEIIEIENLFKKIMPAIKSETTKEALISISRLKNINKNILKELLVYCKNKEQITFSYNSPKTGEKNIEIIADKITYKSDKFYLWGNNVTHKEYSYFAIDRLVKICSIKLRKDSKTFSPIKVTYEIYSNIDNYIPEKDEIILEQTDTNLLIESTVNNEFELIQRLLFMGEDCKIIAPEDFKIKMLNKLKSMRNVYENNTKDQ